ncbi:MAG: hypothetical protein MZV64_63675 [Ignavibacteriales bacterium]|nr:hypothetical protein [Ignavibacteriales bacterium]
MTTSAGSRSGPPARASTVPGTNTAFSIRLTRAFSTAVGDVGGRGIDARHPAGRAGERELDRPAAAVEPQDAAFRTERGRFPDAAVEELRGGRVGLEERLRVDPVGQSGEASPR